MTSYVGNFLVGLIFNQIFLFVGLKTLTIPLKKNVNLAFLNMLVTYSKLLVHYLQHISYRPVILATF